MFQTLHHCNLCLCDWQGSDADSNTSSIEVVEQEAEDEVELGHSNPVSRDTSPECIELEQLMKVAGEQILNVFMHYIKQGKGVGARLCFNFILYPRCFWKTEIYHT